MPSADTCKVEQLPAERLRNGEVVARCRLRSGAWQLELITLGAAITRIEVPDREGRTVNVVLAHARLADDGAGREYFGAIVGRLANRLRSGLLPLDGATHQLATNDGAHHLHGGLQGFDKRVWRIVDLARGSGRAEATLEHVSAAGEEGYPGTLRAQARYTLSETGCVELRIEARTDATTVANLTSHGYFNLRGSGHVLAHQLQLDADRYCVVDRDLLPTGELRLVAGTPFDFREPKPVGRDLGARDPQLLLAGGYDHCLVLTQGEHAITKVDAAAPTLRRAGALTDPESGRCMELWTDQPGVQLYTGNFLDGAATGGDGRRYGRHAGLCLETQRFPDAPHHPSFPSVVLRPGDVYSSTTQWRFTTG